VSKLNVFFEDQKVGELIRDEELTHSFKYDLGWLHSTDKFQLSLALPLQDKIFGNRLTLSFFENLLPEGKVREILGKDYHIESSFEFLKEFGQDCAGAITVSPGEISPFRSVSAGSVEIKMNKVYGAIEGKRSVAEVISGMETGYLSLAGAQDKFPAIYHDESFYLPTGGAPTTHIVKVPIWRMGVDESVYNEYYCMKLAQAVGLNVPNCFIQGDGDHPLFVIERYDRYADINGYTRRLHQQDFCQALGVVSEQKYEGKGGPTLKDNYRLIIKNTWVRKRIENIFSYLDWICFNLLIGNNDSHSKNLSLLLKDEKTELAPFYDLLCTAIYPKLKREFAFKIGGRDTVSRIGKNQLNLLNDEFGLKAGTMIERVLLMRDQLLKHKDQVALTVLEDYPQVKIVSKISDLIGDRCRSLSRQGVESQAGLASTVEKSPG
jgi:serine/threonine-protein kinase HipA